MVTLILPPDLGKKGYRLKCRFVIEARPQPERLKRGTIKALEWFVQDMAKEGWEYVSREPIRFRGPFVPVVPITIHPVRQLSARQMLPAVKQGARFRASEETIARDVTPLVECESWEYELAAVFCRKTILVEVPDRHEEKVGTR